MICLPNHFSLRPTEVCRNEVKEFMKYFEEGCKENNIELYVLPPRSPKHNGRVERFNEIIEDGHY